MDLSDRKQVMELFTYGVYLLTVRDGAEVAASTVTWVSQASFDPLRVTVAVKVDSNVHEFLERIESCALQVIGGSQQDIATAFFRMAVLADGQLNGYAYHDGPVTGAPILDDVPAWLEGQVTGRIAGGDHTIFAIEITNLGIQNSEPTALVLRDTPWHYGK